METPVPTPQELEDKFWKDLESDMTMMLGLAGKDEGHTRPMTAQLDGGQGPIWFFSSTESDLVQQVGQSGGRAVATFTSKDHGLVAAVHGQLSLDNDRATIDRLWNSFVAAWFEGGKDDPKLALLRLDPDRGEIWENGSSIMASIKMLFGIDPKEDYKDQVAKVILA